MLSDAPKLVSNIYEMNKVMYAHKKRSFHICYLSQWREQSGQLRRWNNVGTEKEQDDQSNMKTFVYNSMDLDLSNVPLKQNWYEAI